MHLPRGAVGTRAGVISSKAILDYSSARKCTARLREARVILRNRAEHFLLGIETMYAHKSTPVVLQNSTAMENAQPLPVRQRQDM